MNVERLIRVLSIRSDNPLGKGGCIFYGIAIDKYGAAQGDERFVVVAPFNLLAAVEVEVGQWWHVSGISSTYPSLRNGYQIQEQQIAPMQMKMLLPNGQHIVTLLANGKHFAGVGISKANRLWQRFGESLQSVFENGQIDLLSSVQGISEETANQLVEGWKLYGQSSLLHLLCTFGIDHSTVQTVLEHFGDRATDALYEDPYRLLSFSASWKCVDAIALRHFKLQLDDPRRTNGAVEEALYRLFAEGHSAPSKPIVLRRLNLILSSSQATPNLLSSAVLSRVLERAMEHGMCLPIAGCDRLQQVGAWAMEKKVADFFADRLPSIPGVDQKQIVLSRTEQDCSHQAQERPHPFVQLTDEQRSAICTVAYERVGLISGGAGVGKTTVLKALYEHFDSVGVAVIQVAIAGRAAQRMKEATGRPARTIASFLHSRNQGELDEPFVLVIDEASMVDILTMYRLCHALPDHAKLLMVGDTGQLMPVGPGLVFHDLAQHAPIPHARLTKVLRHGSDIAVASAEIRAGMWPEIGTKEEDPIAFLNHARIEAHSEDQLQIANRILRLYLKSPDSTQILCAHKQGQLGVRALNKLCQDAMGIDQPHLLIWNDEFQMMADTGLRLGDPIVCTKNLKDLGLQNGSLGRIKDLETPRSAPRNNEQFSDDVVLAWAEWDDGERRPMTLALLLHLELAYALTIHKAQGSEWPIVIVPIVRSRLLDRSLIYTAITRAQQQVLLLGDEAAARAAVANDTRASQRSTGLLHHLSEQLNQSLM
jgi:exodeoxyribonuclease V alpha subunit